MSLKLSELCTISPSFQKSLNKRTHIHQPKHKVAFVNASEVESDGDATTDDEWEWQVEEGEEEQEVSSGAALAWVDEAFTPAGQDELYEYFVHEATIEDLLEEEIETTSQPLVQIVEPSLPPGVLIHAKPLIQHAWAKIANDEEEYLAVETCQMIAKIEGRPVVAMLDDGSEINIMPLELWNKLNKEKLLSLFTDVIFNVFGIHGSGEAMLGQTQVAVEFSGVTTHHNFWVAWGVSKVILGMPYIWKTESISKIGVVSIM